MIWRLILLWVSRREKEKTQLSQTKTNTCIYIHRAKMASTQSAPHNTISLVGTIPISSLSAINKLLLSHAPSQRAPKSFIQIEHLLSRVDDQSSAQEESEDNKWNMVRKSRDSNRIKVRQEDGRWWVSDLRVQGTKMESRIRSPPLISSMCSYCSSLSTLRVLKSDHSFSPSDSISRNEEDPTESSTTFQWPAFRSNVQLLEPEWSVFKRRYIQTNFRRISGKEKQDGFGTLARATFITGLEVSSTFSLLSDLTMTWSNHSHFFFKQSR